MSKEKVVVSWSGGKDSAFMLYELMLSDQYDIVSLITNVVDGDDVIKMHRVPKRLLEEQALALNIPLEIINVSPKPKNGEYELKTGKVLEKFKQEGVTAIVFGDLFLEDIKVFRDQCCQKWGVKPIYPLWKRDVHELSQKMLRSGLKAVLTCVDTNVVSEEFVGRNYDETLIKDLPWGVDPCGENGEFHTFVYNCPNFNKEINFKRGKRYLKDSRFYYCELESSLLPV